MPLYEYECLDCGRISEELIVGRSEAPIVCRACGSGNMKKLISAPSSMTGSLKNALPGQGDTGCCGVSPAESSCAGPGSCCGKGRPGSI